MCAVKLQAVCLATQAIKQRHKTLALKLQRAKTHMQAFFLTTILQVELQAWPMDNSTKFMQSMKRAFKMQLKTQQALTTSAQTQAPSAACLTCLDTPARREQASIVTIQNMLADLWALWAQAQYMLVTTNLMQSTTQPMVFHMPAELLAQQLQAAVIISTTTQLNLGF